MPQFDTFSFFSQLFWVFLAFTYFYLVLSFYLLPAFAAVLKVRAKKLAQLNVISNATTLATSGSATNSLFFDSLSTKFNAISFVRKSLPTELNAAFSTVLAKNEAFFNFNSSMLNNFKVVTFFLKRK